MVEVTLYEARLLLRDVVLYIIGWWHHIFRELLLECSLEFVNIHFHIRFYRHDIRCKCLLSGWSIDIIDTGLSQLLTI